MLFNNDMSKPRHLSDEQIADARRLKKLWDDRFDGVISQEEAAHRCGWKTQGAFNQYLNGKIPIGLRALLKISRALQVEPQDISPTLSSEIATTGASEHNTSAHLNGPAANRLPLASGSLTGRRADDDNINVREGPHVRGLVPLISSVQAGEWCDMLNSFEASDAEYWLPCPVRHGPHTFCLVVEGESMRNPHSRPSYDPGDIIFVDPEVTPTTGSRVVVRLEAQSKATFKQYVEEDGQCILKALNPDWKPRYIPLSERAALCGVVIGKWVPE